MNVVCMRHTQLQINSIFIVNDHIIFIIEPLITGLIEVIVTVSLLDKLSLPLRKNMSALRLYATDISWWQKYSPAASHPDANHMQRSDFAPVNSSLRMPKTMNRRRRTTKAIMT
jgi:hypothetical protein